MNLTISCTYIFGRECIKYAYFENTYRPNEMSIQILSTTTVCSWNIYINIQELCKLNIDVFYHCSVMFQYLLINAVYRNYLPTYICKMSLKSWLINFKIFFIWLNNFSLCSITLSMMISKLQEETNWIRSPQKTMMGANLQLPNGKLPTPNPPSHYKQM